MIISCNCLHALFFTKLFINDFLNYFCVVCMLFKLKAFLIVCTLYLLYVLRKTSYSIIAIDCFHPLSSSVYLKLASAVLVSVL